MCEYEICSYFLCLLVDYVVLSTFLFVLYFRIFLMQSSCLFLHYVPIRPCFLPKRRIYKNFHHPCIIVVYVVVGCELTYSPFDIRQPGTRLSIFSFFLQLIYFIINYFYLCLLPFFQYFQLSSSTPRLGSTLLLLIWQAYTYFLRLFLVRFPGSSALPSMQKISRK